MTTELSVSSGVGRYGQLRALGSGAGGRMFLATDRLQAGRLVALKAVSEGEAARLAWEFAVLRDISHPHLAAVFELTRLLSAAMGQAMSALVEEYVEGEQAGQAAVALAEDRDARLRLTLRVGAQVASALAALHARGFVHGDVKPQNIMVGPEIKLIDLGLARRTGTYATANGTPGFMAPELLVGQVAPAADIYALGVTLLVLLGAALDGGSPASSQAALGALRKGPPDTPAWLPKPLQELLGAMVARELVQRPGDALFVAGRLAALLRELGEVLDVAAMQMVGATGRRTALAAASALPLVGQASVVASVVAAVEARPPLVVVLGPAGSGRSRVIREAVHRLQLNAIQDGKVPLAYLAVHDVPEQAPTVDAVIHLTDDSLTGSDTRIAALLQGLRLSGNTTSVVLENRTPPLDVDVPVVQVAKLDPDEVEALLLSALGQATVPRSVIDVVDSLTGGLAGRVCALAAGAHDARIEFERPDAWLSVAAARLCADDTVPADAYPLFDALLVCGGVVTQASLALSADEVSVQLRLLKGGGVAYERAEDAALCLSPRFAEAPLSAARAKAACKRIKPAELPAASRAVYQLSVGELGEGLALLLSEVDRLLGLGQPERAASLALAGLSRGATSSDLHIRLAQAKRAMGAYAEALVALEPCAELPEATVLAAEIHRLAGARDLARALCERLACRTDQHGARALATWARIQLDEGDLAAALQLAERARAHTAVDQEASARVLEVEALVFAMRGEHDRALALATENLERSKSPALSGRAHATLAFVHSLRGSRGPSMAHHRKAAALADRCGELHSAATARVNVGTGALEDGMLALALQELAAGAVRFSRLGRDQDVWRVLFNFAVACALAGDYLRADGVLGEARLAAGRAGSTQAPALLDSFAAELALSRGQMREARGLVYGCQVPADLPTHLQVIVLGRLIEVACGLDLEDLAGSSLQSLEVRCREQHSAEGKAELALARARVLILSGEGERARAQAESGRILAREANIFELKLRALLLSARCAQERGDAPAAQQSLAEARSMLEHAAAGLPAQDLLRMRAAAPYQSAFATSPTDGAQLQRADSSLAFAKRFLFERRPEHLFEKILDAAVALAAVERGYLVTLHPEGKIRVRSARGLDKRSLPLESKALSSSIVGEVLRQGRPVATTDAMADLRLSDAASVHAMSLRSVAAVPLVIAGEVKGAIYLEDRLRPAVFDSGLLDALLDLSVLAAQAIDAAELLRRERRARRRLSVAQKRLSQQIEAQAIELRVLREERSVEGSALGLVGRNEGFLKTLTLASRVARSDLPALIYGESGTGKELVARAIHEQSERGAGPFVAENCTAVPEPLLESTLFGHVRGAFTGADRGRRGLFELADGGTLLLDEVGEMPLSMQVRLLRVLQEGEVLPVGAERPRKVDVRVVAATHRDLPQLVKEGRFRQDLFYRLAVVTVEIPPLRARVDDIPELVASFAERFAPGRNIKIERRAMDALCAYSWPGNVRQLENEVRRALLFAEDRLTEAHLSPELTTQVGKVVSPLDLHGQVAALERRLVGDALQQTRGNQTKAADRLGISRYGLLKMIRRLDIQVPVD